MKITIIQVGKTKHTFFQEAEEEYLKRLKPFAKVNIVTLKEASVQSTTEALRNQAKAKEAEEILKSLPDDSYLIALDEHGKGFSSQQFAQFIGKNRDFEGANITFIIGGPFGLDAKILTQAKLKLSFSAFTFTHEAIRTLLLEQIYRAFTILTGKTYHY